MKKIENSPFDPFVKWFFPQLLPYVPAWLSANGITIIGMVASALACLSLYLTRWSPWMCLLGAVFVFVHWFADTLDGVVARARRPTQLGFYLDHFGDALSVALIGMGIFMIEGAHFVIGLVIVIFYLLLIISGLIRAELTRVMELPVFGPTELHLLVIALLIAQPFTDYGQPISWLPAIAGNNGWLTLALGFDRGLTMLDVVGIVVIGVASIMLLIEMIITINRLAAEDRQ